MLSQNILWTFYFSSYVLVSLATGPDCPPPDNCVPSRCSLPEDCKHGTTLDSCSCCKVCISHLDEDCGGERSALGACLQGLNCLKSHPNDSRGVCRPENPCEKTECPDHNITCPSDSYKLLAPKFDGCCPPPPRCSCLPERCEPANCAPGLIPKLKVKGNGLPGSCCSIFDCIQTPQHCTHEGTKYQNGESWKPDNCTTCACQGGLTLCQTVECDSGTCNRHQPSDGNCCPPCTECRSKGVIHKNAETWAEDDCTYCQCLNGTVNCVATLCDAPKCVNPKRIPGQCCPVCDECSLICPHGYRKNDLGQEVCECASERDLQPCTPGVTCDKQCQNGYALSESGCTLCECKDCKAVEKPCNKMCKHGYKKDRNGCKFCECRSTTPFFSKLSGAAEICVYAGLAYLDGQSWQDGCRRCVCLNGKEACELLPAGIRRTGDGSKYASNSLNACKEVTLHENITESVSQLNVCSSEHAVERSLWKLDNCMNCTCVNKKIYCQTHICPSAPCRFPVQPGGSCCPYCIDTIPTSNPFIHTNKHCLSNGKTYYDGQSWRNSACESCSCRNGKPECFNETCSQDYKHCKAVYHIKNRCCPLCLDSKSDLENCRYNKTTYRNGEKWDLNPCWSCVCMLGQPVCSEKTCSNGSCGNDPKQMQLCCSHCASEHEQSEGSTPSQLLIAIALFCSLTIAVAMIVISVLIYLVTQPNHFRISSLSWPSTSSTSTNIDYREQDRLNISYSKIADCDKSGSLVNV